MHRTNGDAQRLLAGAPEAATVQATYVIGLGWHVRVIVRRQFQEWGQAAREDYEGLSTEECVQVIEDALTTNLLEPR